jgi:hypothetical protein
MAKPLRFLAGSLAALLCAGALAGCPDPDVEFEEFNARWCTPENIRETFSYCPCDNDAQCGDGDSGWVCDGGSCVTGCRGADGNNCQPGVECSSTDSSVGKCAIGCDTAPAALGEPDGLYFFSLVPPQSPKKPAPLLATLTTTADGSTGLSFSLELQPVDAEDRMTQVGDPFTVGPFEVNADGSFEADWGPFAVPGETNPLTPSVLEADIVTLGALCTMQDDVCGIASGQITSPVVLDIAGSTFYMEKIDDIADHTEPVLLNCAGDTGNTL